MTDSLLQPALLPTYAFLLCVWAYVAGLLWFVRGIGRADASRATDQEHASEPLVSVVVAARNEAANIGSCVRQLCEQSYPADRYEIIVVDDDSTDDTAAIVEALRASVAAADHRINLLLLRTQDEGAGSGSKKMALQLGIDRSRGEILLTTDADCSVPATWIEAMVAAFAPDVGMVIGYSQIGPAGSVTGWRQGWEALDFLYLMSGALGSAGGGLPMAAAGQNLGFRKRAFDEVGGYAPILHRASGDDVLLLQMIRRTGRWRFAFAGSAAASVVHPPSPSLRDLVRKRARWASNAPCQMRLDPAFFLGLCASLGLALVLALTPLWLVWGGIDGRWLALGWGSKTAAELALLRRSARALGVTGPMRYYPLWALTQPLYVVAAGVLGLVGRFSWKGRAYSGGQTVGRSAGPR